MIPKYRDSRIEIWCDEYINNKQNRNIADQKARIVQIEPAGNGDDYIVEVQDE